MPWNVSGSVHDKYQFHPFQRPEIALVQQRTLVAQRLPARIHSACTVNKTHPWGEEEQSPWQRVEARREKIPIQTGTEKALRFVYQLALSIPICQSCSPHRSDDRC